MLITLYHWCLQRCDNNKEEINTNACIISKVIMNRSCPSLVRLMYISCPYLVHLLSISCPSLVVHVGGLAHIIIHIHSNICINANSLLKFNSTISGTLRPTNINWRPVLSNIEPPQIRRDGATLQEYKKYQQLMDYVPIKEILCEPPKSGLRSRRPFVIEAARNGAGYGSSHGLKGSHPDRISWQCRI